MGKNHVENWDGRRADILVAGTRSVVRLPRALVAPAAERTILSPKVARQVARSLGPVRSARLGEHAKIQGPTTKVAVAIDGYTAVDVVALVGDLLPRVGATVGADVLKRAVRVRRQDGPARQPRLASRRRNRRERQRTAACGPPSAMTGVQE